VEGSQPAGSRRKQVAPRLIRRCEKVEPSLAPLARELQKLVGYGLTPAKQQNSPQIRSVGAIRSWLPPGHTLQEEISTTIRRGIYSIQTDRYVKHLHRTPSARKIRAILDDLLFNQDNSSAFARRKKALKSLGCAATDSSVDWWRRPGNGPEYDLMLILAESLLSVLSETDTGAIQYEEATYYIHSYGALFRSEHRVRFMAKVDGFEYLQLLIAPRPSWTFAEYGMKPAVNIHTTGVEALHNDTSLGFHFLPMDKGESHIIEWDFAYDDAGDLDRSSGVGHSAHFEYLSYLLPTESLTIKLCAPDDWYGEYVRFFSHPVDEHSYEAMAEGHLAKVVVIGGQKVVQHQFRDLRPGWKYGMLWRFKTSKLISKRIDPEPRPKIDPTSFSPPSGAGYPACCRRCWTRRAGRSQPPTAVRYRATASATMALT
jgi:hypothetical protein